MIRRDFITLLGGAATFRKFGILELSGDRR